MGGLALSTIPLSQCQGPQNPASGTDQATQEPAPEDFPLLEVSINELQQKMESGELSALQITEMYLNRIEQLDQNGPKVNSIMELNPDAQAIAQQIDQERADGKVRGPMHGIPVIIKDNIDTGDKMLTTAGSIALMDNKATEDAFIVKRLRESGAVLLGKANLSEWANFRSSRSSSGWSSRGGQTHNPYVLDRSPCGSSSGSGAAVSANFCAIAIGTETNGSIVCPSSINGVVGLKPTVGLWSRTGIIPISESQDTAGPMGRSVMDVAILLGACTGMDPEDPKTNLEKDQTFKDYTEFLAYNEEALQGTRVGLPRSFMGFHELVDARMEEAVDLIKQAGCEVLEFDDVIENIRELYSLSSLVLQYEFKAGLKTYFSRDSYQGKPKSLADIIAFNQENAEQAMPYFLQERMLQSEKRGELSDTEYVNAKKVLQKRSREGIENTLRSKKCAAFISPTGGPAWPIDVVNGDHFGGGSSSPAAWSGFPSLTVPNGYIHGLPVGLSFTGLPFAEFVLLKLGHAYELVSKHRKPPQFLPTLPY